MSPEQLLQVGRVSPIGITQDGNALIYSVSTPDIKENKNVSKTYSIDINSGDVKEIESADALVKDHKVSPDGTMKLGEERVKLKAIAGSEIHEDLPESDVKIYESLDYRHWDTWRDGKYRHVFLYQLKDGKQEKGKDLMANEPYDCPPQSLLIASFHSTPKPGNPRRLGATTT